MIGAIGITVAGAQSREGGAGWANPASAHGPGGRRAGRRSWLTRVHGAAHFVREVIHFDDEVAFVTASRVGARGGSSVESAMGAAASKSLAPPAGRRSAAPGLERNAKSRSFRHDRTSSRFESVRPAEPLSKHRAVVLKAGRLPSHDARAHCREVAGLLTDTQSLDPA
jgi:hypothetical protein